MIFYFTGTGNSLHAARVIARGQGGEQPVPIAAELRKPIEEMSYRLASGELLGFIFPVYSWGPPKLVLDFIAKVRFTVEGSNGNEATATKPYVFCVAVPADEEGRTMQITRRALTARGLAPDAWFGLRMPSNYMVGFDLESPEAVAAKLAAAEIRLAYINVILRERRTGVFEPYPGRFPRLKSATIYHLFNSFGRTPKYYSADDTCNSCGLCARVCPMGIITVAPGAKPVWKGDCVQCFSCINRCPQEAIQYGKGTRGKGRYIHPEYK